MKKPQYIAAVLAIAVTVIGAGYASWSEGITLNNTVETGNLRVEFVQTGIHPYVAGFDNSFTVPCKVYTNLIHGPKVTEIEIKNLYPGATALFETRIENLGSIPAVAENAQVTFSAGTSDIIKENIICRGQILHWRPGSIPMLIEAKGIPVDTGVKLKDLGATLSAMVQGMELLPGDFLTFDVTDEYAEELAKVKDFESFDLNGKNSLFLTLPSSSGSDTEKQSADFQIVFNFKQFNK